jgi:hypothetical protein
LTRWSIGWSHEEGAGPGETVVETVEKGGVDYADDELLLVG